MAAQTTCNIPQSVIECIKILSSNSEPKLSTTGSSKKVSPGDSSNGISISGFRGHFRLSVIIEIACGHFLRACRVRKFYTFGAEIFFITFVIRLLSVSGCP